MTDETNDTDEKDTEEGWVETLASLNGGHICATCDHSHPGEKVRRPHECSVLPPTVVADGKGSYTSACPDVEFDSHCIRYYPVDIMTMREVGMQLQEEEEEEEDDDPIEPECCCGAHGCPVTKPTTEGEAQ